jgi:hypothetical protein
MISRQFGVETRRHIERMASIALPRKLLERQPVPVAAGAR